MFHRPLPRNLRLSHDLSPDQVSQAWEFLVSLCQNPHLLEMEPPEHLSHLTESDWHLLDSLLYREMKLKEQSLLQ